LSVKYLLDRRQKKQRKFININRYGTVSGYDQAVNESGFYAAALDEFA